MINNRKLVYLLALVFTVAFAATAFGEVPPTPENPATYTTATPVTIELNKDLTVTAELVNDDDEPLPDQDILFRLGKDENGDGNIDDGTLIAEHQNVKTNSSGVAETTFTVSETGFTSGEDVGDYTYKAYYAGSSDPEYDSSQDTATVTVEKIPTVLEVRAVNSPEEDRPGSRVRGGYSLNEIGEFYRTGPKRKSCVYIHIYTHSTPGVV